jgi:hypothetical protein
MELIDFKMGLGILAGVLIFFSYFSYIYTTLKGKTKPNRATWFMLASISSLILITYKDLGASSTLWIASSAAYGTCLVAFLSIKYGTGGWSWFERICIATTFLCFIFYIISENAFITLILSLVMDSIALLPTIYHAYKVPKEEDIVAWTLTLCADALGVIAIDTWIADIYIYPIYMLIVNGIVVVLLYRRFLFGRRRNAFQSKTT